LGTELIRFDNRRSTIDNGRMLNITDVRITKIEGDEKLRAFAAIVIEDCFLVGDLRVVEGEDGYFVAMPSKRKRDGSFKDIAYPLNNEVRTAIEERVLLAYETASGNRAISRIEKGEGGPVRPDLLGVEEFGFTPKANPN
jgi:stage V sporulation protein G